VKILDVEFAGAMGSAGDPVPGDLPQVAFAGRSNVGKSSLINRLLGRHRQKIARVSGSPGKTREINFYRVRAELSGGRTFPFLVVDLPGYGYARAPQSVRARWRPLIEGFLQGNGRLAGVVQLVDMRHAPTRDDLQMIEFLASLGIPTLLVLTKADKLKAMARARREAELAADLGLDGDQVIPFSSITGEGRDALLDSLDGLLSELEP
jgi:GTP-binding protein